MRMPTFHVEFFPPKVTVTKPRAHRHTFRCDNCQGFVFSIAKEDGVIKIRCNRCDLHIKNLSVQQTNASIIQTP